jgi:hypothetical protein
MILQEQEAKAFLIVITFVMSVLFMAVDSGRTCKPFPFYQKWEDGEVISRQKQIKAEIYVYHLNEYLILIVAFHIIKTDVKKFKTFYQCVFYSLCFDVVDYMLTYNTEWIYIGWLPISANILIMSLICVAFIFDVWKDNQ